MADSPITVTSLSVTPGFRLNVLRWTASIGSCLPYLALDKFEVYSATVNNINSAVKVGESADVSFTHPGLIIGAARYYWVRARDVSGNLGDFYPPSATGGIVGVPTSIGTGVVGHDELQDDAVDFNNLRANSVRANHLQVDRLDAISSVLGDVEVNGALVLNGTVSRGKLGAHAVTDFNIDDQTGAGNIAWAINNYNVGTLPIVCGGPGSSPVFLTAMFDATSTTTAQMSAANDFLGITIDDLGGPGTRYSLGLHKFDLTGDLNGRRHILQVTLSYRPPTAGTWVFRSRLNLSQGQPGSALVRNNVYLQQNQNFV